MVLSRTSLAAFGLVASACGSSDADLPPPNLLLITIDTLRADHLGTYGYGRDTSPNLDRLAARSTVFERAYSSSSWTLPSLATLMTSQYTSTHRCLMNNSRLSDSFETLAERFASAGFRTGAVTTHVFLGERYGLGQGFDEYDDELVLETNALSHRAVTSPGITKKGIAWLEARALEDTDRPWFLWLHYFDPHSGYRAHAGVSEAFGVDTPLDRYDGEIAFTDRAIGDVLTRLDELELSEDTVIVVLADHGEEFGDHGAEGHRHTLYEEVLRVPLIMHVPELAPQRIGKPIGTVDLYPTLLELAGIEVPELPDSAEPGPAEPGPAEPAAAQAVEGRSLVPALLGHELEARPVLGELGKDRWDTLVLGRWKLLRDRPGERVLLFDIVVDPGESTDLSAEYPERVAEMAAQLDRKKRKAWKKGRSRAEWITLTEDDQRTLSELGYGGDGEDEEEAGSRDREQDD